MKLRSSLAALVWAAAIAGVSAQGSAAKVDVTGKWILNVETDAGGGMPTLTFKQEGEKLTGTYQGQLGQTDLVGTVKGNAIEFSFNADTQGIKFVVTYTGTVEKDTMKGTLNLGDLAQGTFTGKRQ